jgi:transcriptional regulator with XRE-family HTH domain
MTIQTMRVQRSWSQEQLAELSGLSVRTIQRLEKGENPSIESLKALASVFEIQISELQQNADISTETAVLLNENQISKYVKSRRIFRFHLAAYFFVLSVLIAIIFLDPRSANFSEVNEVGFSWGIAVLIHLICVLKQRSKLFDAAWDENQIKQEFKQVDC